MLSSLIICLIKFYRYFFSSIIPPSCRFSPSCSQYALEAVARFGPGKGLLLTIWRIVRCNPFHPGGYDPVIKL